MSVADFVEAICSTQRLSDIITDHRVIKGTPSHFEATRKPWPRAITTLLDTHHIRLFSHQALATDHIRAGHSVVVSTPTASGKSLIYNLPVLEECLLDPEAHAIYLFPLKALAQDQLQTFINLSASWPDEVRPKAALYDGDTPENERRHIRKNPPQVLITNPEMLHLGIIPWHNSWATFLAGLRFIVVDEAHTYRGIFGSNMAMLFRRLNRLVARYGQRPTYVLCTATVGNPKELATSLIDPPKTDEPVVISKSGAPQSDRHFLFMDPLLSPSTTAIDLIQLSIKLGLRSIVYCKSRKMTELISMWADNSAPPRYKSLISAYRAGYLPEERRDIEKKMANGELRCVVSTSALELGIDIGGLDVCILVGYPGTIMSTLQRGGRVGRAGQESCVILIAGEDALDQYFIHNPDDFFSRPPEKAVVNPDNEIIASRHLECAAAELPLNIHEEWLQSEPMQSALSSLVAQAKILYTHDKQSLVAQARSPQRSISLRSGGSTCIIEDQNAHIIGSIDTFRAWHEAHPGAVYLHRGQSYVITDFDPAKGRIKAEQARVPWFTRVRSKKSTVILKETERMGLGRSLLVRGCLRITDTITGYEKRSNSGNKLLDIVPLTVPPNIFETEGIWYVIPEQVRGVLEDRFIHFMGSIHACEHAIIGLLPLQVMADRNDFGGISTPLHPQVGASCIFIYDGVPGGAGLTREAFHYGKTILLDTFKGIRSCPCESGCPSCVHSPKCGSGNRPISKSGAITLLEELLKEGDEGDRLVNTLQISLPRFPDDSGKGTERPAKEGSLSLQTPSDEISPKTGRYPKSKTQEACIAQTAISHPTVSNAKHSSPLAAPPDHYVVFDVETRRSAGEVGGWTRAERMGVSITIAYDSKRDSYLRFEQDELGGLFDLFKEADVVIGFNSLRFDYAVLSPFAPYDLWSLPSLDLLQKVKERLNYRLSLDALAMATLGSHKSANGLLALKWWKEQRLDDIAKYCQEDVKLTRELYLFGLGEGHLFFITKNKQKVLVDVDFQSFNSGIGTKRQ
ncbi:MAG: DEAD/DEAH box helicase [Desulfovibrio sp.]|nr:DEAD/DEAH box helicase [Desulfovibrio sp.]